MHVYMGVATCHPNGVLCACVRLCVCAADAFILRVDRALVFTLHRGVAAMKCMNRTPPVPPLDTINSRSILLPTCTPRHQRWRATDCVVSEVRESTIETIPRGCAECEQRVRGPLLPLTGILMHACMLACLHVCPPTERRSILLNHDIRSVLDGKQCVDKEHQKSDAICPS